MIVMCVERNLKQEINCLHILKIPGMPWLCLNRVKERRGAKDVRYKIDI